MQIIEYDRDAAVAYARKWALSRNPAFYNFDKIGGDCTNFASQSLFAGSGIMNYTPVYGWFYRNASDRTASWTGVRYLYNFLVNNRSVGPFAREVSKHEIMPGDIIQLGNSDGHFYHSPVVSAVMPEILVCAHTDDALDRPLSTYIFENIRYLHIENVRIW